ncbi:MAG: carboxypeptidase-like regulatory domain-containing protein [Lewinella sp.]|nr:carboxypeptidase-like regulatory domain-containing protein [Lewinella sp.]
MRHPIRFDIPEPCRVSWPAMRPAGDHQRHCDRCDRTLIDFTGFTDRQLAAYFGRQGDQLCGRFRPDQLGRFLYHEQPRAPWWRWITATVSLAGAAIFPEPVHGQAAPPPQGLVEHTPATPGQATTDDPPGPRTIRGVVYEQGTEEPLIGANIVIVGTAWGTVTDLDGTFTLSVPVGSHEIEVSYTGYTRQRIELPDNPDQAATIVLEMNVALDPAYLLGEVAIIRPNTLWDLLRPWWFNRRHHREVRRRERRIAASINAIAPVPQTVEAPPASSEEPTNYYLAAARIIPNPAAGGARVELTSDTAHTLKAHCFDEQGRLLWFTHWIAVPGHNQWRVDQQLQPLSGGTYYLLLEDESGDWATVPVVIVR